MNLYPGQELLPKNHLPFQLKTAKLMPRSLTHVEGGQEAEEKNAQAQVSQAEKAHEAQPQIGKGWTWPPNSGEEGRDATEG